MKSNNFFLIIPKLRHGGGVRVMLQFANLICDHFKNVIIITNEYKTPYPINSKIKILEFNSRIRFIGILKIWYQIYTFRNNSNYYFFSDPISSLIAFILKKNAIRFLQHDDLVLIKGIFKNFFIFNLIKFLILKSFTKENYYLFNSVYSYNSFINNTRYKINKYPYFFSPIADLKFKNNKIKNFKNNTPFNLCIMARNYEWKGFNEFHNAFMKFKDKKIINKIYIISQDQLSFKNDKYLYIKPHSDDDILKIFSKCQIFIQNSNKEGFGLPALEAMSYGLCSIISRAGGTEEYTKDKINCLTYDFNSPEEIFEIIKKLSKNNKLMNKIRKNALNITSKFNTELQKKQIYKFFSQINLNE